MKDVIFNNMKIAKINNQKIYKLKQKMDKSFSGKIRYCLHANNNDSLHEMIILQRKDVYVRPHKHENKSESFHIIEGIFFIVIFDNKGKVASKILMDDRQKENNFLCRIDSNIWHTIIPVSEFIIFHETTNGPYVGKGDSILAPWAPCDNRYEIKKYIKSILSK